MSGPSAAGWRRWVEEALFFRVSGRVRNVYAKRNGFVTAGQVIADLEVDDLERELTSTQLNLERAQSRLHAAKRSLEFQIRRAQINLDIAALQLLNLRTERPDANFAIAVQNKQVELAEIALEQLNEGVDPLLVNGRGEGAASGGKVAERNRRRHHYRPLRGPVALGLADGRPRGERL